VRLNGGALGNWPKREIIKWDICVVASVRAAELRRWRRYTTLLQPAHPERGGQAEYRMIVRDITSTNRAVRALIDRTENPRHRYLLMAYDRHRNLEMAGRYEELFAPDMMVEQPVYHIHANGLRVKLHGQEDIKHLYRVWAATNQSVFYTEREHVAVSDQFVTSVAVGYHQVTGRSLFQNKILSYLPEFMSRFLLSRAFAGAEFKADDRSMYLYKNTFCMIWPYDDCGRLIGEQIWEPEPCKAEIFKLAPAHVLTTKDASRLLAPFIKPLPALHEMLDDAIVHPREHMPRSLALGIG
jgi:hypothetical protein